MSLWLIYNNCKYKIPNLHFSCVAIAVMGKYNIISHVSHNTDRYSTQLFSKCLRINLSSYSFTYGKSENGSTK